MIKISDRLKNILLHDSLGYDDHQSFSSNKERLNFGEIIQRKISMKLSSCGIARKRSDYRIKRYRNIHKDGRAFILGNGPSLNKCNLKYLKDEITFGVNAIFLNYEKMGYFPTYYVVEDIFVAEDRREEIIKYIGPQKFIGNALKYCLKGSHDTVWLNVRYKFNEYEDFPHFSTDCEKELWVGGTVSYICLQMAFYMGIKEVYLIGFDHNYYIKSDVKKKGVDFESMSGDPNHFHSGYFGKGYRWHDPKLERMEKAYKKAKKIYELNGRKIYNATIGGKLEIFERREYDKIFQKEKD